VDIIKFAVGVCMCVRARARACVRACVCVCRIGPYRVDIMALRNCNYSYQDNGSCVLVGSAILWPSKEVRFEVNYLGCT